MISEFDVGLRVVYHADIWPASRSIGISGSNTPPSTVQRIEKDAEVTARFRVLFDPDGQWIDEVMFRPVGVSGDFNYSMYLLHQDQIPLFEV